MISRAAPRRWMFAFVLATVAVLLSTGAFPTAEDQAVTWVNQVNVTVTGTVLQKTAGWDGSDDAGASSEQQLTAGDGYIQFTVGEAGTFWLGGLSHGDDNTTWGDIDYAFRFNGAGSADVFENGIYKSGGDTSYEAGDVFRIAVEGGRVHYSKNGLYLRESETLPQYPLGVDVALGTVGATVHNAVLGVSPPPPPGGGFTEKAGSPARRARFTAAQIESFLPPAGATGAFTFPAPYNTTGVRLTNASVCAEGSDCLWYSGYSYWRNTNNHVASADMYIFLGTDPNRGGSGPILLRYNKVTDAVQNLGPMFAPTTAWANQTGEGWYFSATMPNKLYVHLVGSPYLRRFNILTRRLEVAPVLDLTRCPRPRVCPADAAAIVQAHSSDNDRVHSATVQNADWQRTGCVVQGAPAAKYLYFAPAAGYQLDECHVDKSGLWLALLETRSDGTRINRIVDLTTRRITTITAANGALGHLDMGHGYAVGADTFSALPNATTLLKFPVLSTQRPIGPVVHYNKRWDIAAANHLAHGNARRGVAPESQYACGSNATRVADMADEIVCFSLNSAGNADGSLDVLVVGQVLTDLDALGGRDDDGDDYEQTPKGNLDVTGRYFIWTTNVGGNRLDAFIVKVPAERMPGLLRTATARKARR